MVSLDPYLLSVILFVIILAVIIYKDRKKIEFKYILFLRRTKRFRDNINAIAEKSPRFWKIIGSIAIVAAFVVMIYSLIQIGNLVYLVYSGAIDQPAVQAILPIPSASGATGPGYILIPFWTWVITIGIILIPHELFHGIIARAENIRLKSVGLLLFAIFPGAFVEPDEKQLKKSKIITKLRVFSAGSFANFFISALFFVLTVYVIWQFTVNPTISLTLISANETTPIYAAGLRGGMVVTEINGKPLTPSYFEYLGGFFQNITPDYIRNGVYIYDEIGNIQPGDTITFKADGRIFSINVAEHPSFPGQDIPYICTRCLKNNEVLRTGTEFFGGSLMQLLTMIWILSLAVGAVNILPLYPLDGGLMIQAVSEKLFKKSAKRIVSIITYVMLIALLYVTFGPLLQNL